MNQAVRILHVVTHMNRGGLETMIMNYYRHIDRNQVQFDFLVHRDARGHYDDEIEAMGGMIYRLPRLIPWSYTYKKALNGFFANHPEYRVVHVHQDCLSSVILKAAKKHGVPVRIAHSHNASQDKDIKYLIKVILKRAIPKYATALFACGESAGKWMFGNSEFNVLNNAIDIEKYRQESHETIAIREQLHIPAGAFVVGHVGRFSLQKNHEFLIDIFAETTRKNPDARLLLVGDGELRPAIEKKVQSLGLEDKVIFTGVRPDVNALLQAMDVFVFPSHYEGMALVSIEAQAAGLPCIVSDGVPKDCMITELVQSVPLRAAPEQWAEIILKAKREYRPDTYEEIARAGFDITRQAKWLQEYYLSQQKASE